MRATAFGAFTLGAVILTGHLAASTGPIPLNCNRTCLEGLIDQYLAAVVAHDPKRLPLSEDVMYTENNQVLKVGDGFWKTAAGIGNYKHVFADPEFGQVGFMGTMQEAGAPLLMSLRLRIELGRITEIESIYFRPGGGGPNNIAAMDQSGKAEDIWFKSIPPAQRLSRQEMIAIADGYFTGLQKNDGKGIQGHGHLPVHPGLSPHRERGADDERAQACQRNAGNYQPVLDGLPVAVQDGPVLRRTEHSPSPVSAGRRRARRRLGTLGLRPGHGERGHALGRHEASRIRASTGQAAFS